MEGLNIEVPFILSIGNENYEKYVVYFLKAVNYFIY